MDLRVVSLCNAGTTPLQVWIEPWCDELVVPPRGELTLKVDGDCDVEWEPELEATDHGLTVWGVGGRRIRFLVNEIEQDTRSAVITPPSFGNMETKTFINVVFGNFPETRPGGVPTPSKWNWFQRLFGRP
jgi:hypothetical protein